MDSSFGSTLSAIGAGLQIRHIAVFDLHTCDIGDDVDVVWGDPGVTDFDQIPVRGAGGRIVGVLERKRTLTGGNAGQRMRPLDDALLIGESCPLYTFVRSAREAHYRLVLTEDGIKGVVTGSDLLKLPARLLAFAFVTHLESTLARLIQTRYRPYDVGWMQVLSGGRREKIDQKRRSLSTRRSEPEPLELADFCDKRDIVERLFDPGPTFLQDMKAVEALRNSVAHAGRFVSDEVSDVHDFVGQIEAAHRWIEALESKIESGTGDCQPSLALPSTRRNDGQ